MGGMNQTDGTIRLYDAQGNPVDVRVRNGRGEVQTRDGATVKLLEQMFLAQTETNERLSEIRELLAWLKDHN